MPKAFRLLLPAAMFAALALPMAQAQAVAPGVPNFHEVNTMVYRGGQPNSQGYQSLAKLGIKTILDLRDDSTVQPEKRAVEAAHMQFISIPMSGNGIGEPSKAKVAEALGLLEKATGPIFVHCQKGSDRTGTVVAYYRMDHDHWNPSKALNEADHYGMSWINVGMKRYIKDYTPATSVAAVAAAAAAATPGATTTATGATPNGGGK